MQSGDWNSTDLCLSTKPNTNTECHYFQTAIKSNYYGDKNSKLIQYNEETRVLLIFVYQQTKQEHRGN